MPVFSMTGFGRGEAIKGGLKVEVELCSVNRKQFDVRISLPRQFAVLESRIFEQIHKAVRRGHIQGSLKVTSGAGARRATVDRVAAAACVKSLRRAARELGLQDDLSARSLLSLPDVVRLEGVQEDPEAVWPTVGRALAQALRELRRMARAEGKALESDLSARLRKLHRYHSRISALAPKVLLRYRRALKARLKEGGVSPEVLTHSMAQEIVMFADRSDIAEELTRLQSHFGQAADILSSGDPAGRALDFLCQEMFREINTIGSKANDSTITSIVVHFKTELESFREQVQNVE